MRSDYQGYLIKFGDYQLPNSFITEYAIVPNQRIEKKAWRNNTEYLQRVTSPNFKTTIKPVVRKMNQDEFDLFISIKAHGLLNVDQRKYNVTYWNTETMTYATGEFYVPDIENKITHIADNDTGEMYYDGFTWEMIQY